jgi:hypothetical protein
MRGDRGDGCFGCAPEAQGSAHRSQMSTGSLAVLSEGPTLRMGPGLCIHQAPLAAIQIAHLGLKIAKAGKL